MATYRIYWLEANDRIHAADYAECASDEDAVTKAHELIGQSSAIEVWEGKRHVATLRAGQATSSTKLL